MTKKLYVGNLPYTVNEDNLRELFGQVGEITSVSLITDKYTGQSKGFSFVEMSTEAEAQEAIKRFNGYTLDNRSLNVSEARPREERSGGGSRFNDRRGGNRNRY